MKKFMFGLFALALLMFNAPVSFASDGPETTKDCVIDNAVDMESAVIIDEVVKSAEKTVVLVNDSSFSVVKSDTTFNKMYVANSNTDYRRMEINRHIDPGRVVAAYNHTNKKTNVLAYGFDDPNCMTRQLYQM